MKENNLRPMNTKHAPSATQIWGGVKKLLTVDVQKKFKKKTNNFVETPFCVL